MSTSGVRACAPVANARAGTPTVSIVCDLVSIRWLAAACARCTRLCSHRRSDRNYRTKGSTTCGSHP